MNTELSVSDLSPVRRLKMHRSKPRPQLILVYDTLVCVVVIVLFATFFFAMKLGLELGLRSLTHEITVHLRTTRGF